MTAPIVVGYSATERGGDAAALAARLALAMSVSIVFVLVLPDEERPIATAPSNDYDEYVREQADAWLVEAGVTDPASLDVSTVVRRAATPAEGLLEAAHEVGASYIVVGAANGGLRGRHLLGTVATALLHSSDVPVVLAPEGTRRSDPTLGVTRITAAVGVRPGADVLLEESVALSAATGAELRLLSLMALDLPQGIAGMESAAGHADEVLVHARAALPKGVDADVVVGLGDSIEDAVSQLRWEPGELAIVGSRRLARHRRLFLGPMAAKMLRELPVPMIVVPRTRKKKGARS